MLPWGMIHDHPSFDDGRGRYPDRIAAAAPRGFRDQVKRAAQAERITMGEFVRRAICAPDRTVDDFRTTTALRTFRRLPGRGWLPDGRPRAPIPSIAMSAHLYWPYGPLFLALTFLAFIVAGIGNA